MQTRRFLIIGFTLFLSFFQTFHLSASGELDLAVGYRQDDLKWSIAGPNNQPNILSELKWNELQIWQVQLSGRSLESYNLYIRYSFSYGEIFDGKNQDSDYFGNHRTNEFSRSYSDAGRGEVVDTSAAFGYMIKLPKGLNIAPLFGSSYHTQNLHMYHGVQVVNTLTDALGEIKGLNSRYKTKWNGPWVGADLIWQISPGLSLLGTFEYHWAKFRGKGHWNLRHDHLDDFKHKANGYGAVVKFGAVYEVFPRVLLTLMFGSQNWATGSGTDTTKALEVVRLPSNQLVDVPVKYKTKLNKVEWNSYEVTLGIGCYF